MDLLSRALELGSNVAKGVVDFTACRGNSMECNGTGFVKELAIGFESIMGLSVQCDIIYKKC